jgi:hypothetical protein
MINNLLQWNRLRSLLGRSEAYLLEKRVAEIEDNWRQAYGAFNKFVPQSYRQFVMAFGYPTVAIDGDCCLGFLPAYEAIRITKHFNISGACLFAVCSPQENIYVGFTHSESGKISIGIFENGNQIGELDSFEQWLAEQVQFFLRLIVAIPVEELQNLEQGLHHNNDPLGIMTQQLPVFHGRVPE